MNRRHQRTKVLAGNLAAIAFLVSPLMVVVLSGVSAPTGTSNTEAHVACWVLIAMASVIAAINLFLSFLRPWMHARSRGNTREGARHVSGVPMVGSILAVLAAVVDWGSLSMTAAAFALLLADTGGVVWLLATVARDRSFWKRPA